MRSHHNSWLDVFAGFRIAFSMKKILLGTLGLYVTLIVLIGLLYAVSPWWPDGPAQLDAFLKGAPGACGDLIASLGDGVARMQSGGMPYPTFAATAGVGVILLLIWSLFGGAICRMAAVDFASDESHPLDEGISFTLKRFGSFFWSPLVPFIVVIILMMCASLVGVVGRIPVVGEPLMGLFSFVAIFLSWLAVLVLLCGVFGAIFCWPTIATEGTNAFDAISRSFNYILARPWKTVWCLLVAMVYGSVCMAFVGAFTWAMLALALKCMAFGMGEEAFANVGAIAALAGDWRILPGVSTTQVIAGMAMKVFFILFWGFALGFMCSYKFTAWTLIYFVIRRDVDGTDMSEVFLPETQEALEGPEEAVLDSDETSGIPGEDTETAANDSGEAPGDTGQKDAD